MKALKEVLLTLQGSLETYKSNIQLPLINMEQSHRGSLKSCSFLLLNNLKREGKRSGWNLTDVNPTPNFKEVLNS